MYKKYVWAEQCLTTQILNIETSSKFKCVLIWAFDNIENKDLYKFPIPQFMRLFSQLHGPQAPSP